MTAIQILTIVTCLLGAVKPDTSPNIVVILGDDIGWNDFGFHGSSQIPTPNIDALGYNGVFLNRFYTQATCSPSRAAFLTGNYPLTFGYQGLPLSEGEDRPLPYDVQLLPQQLKKLGYKTHMVGKWHLSAARAADTPTGRGFDSHFGYWHGYVGYFNYFSYNLLVKNNQSFESWSGLDLYDNLEPKWELSNQKYATELFTEKALDVIDNHNTSEPLFLYLAHLAAHSGAYGFELGVPNTTETRDTYSYISSARRQLYAEVVNRLDESVGQVVKKLGERGMLENSIIVFLSDNGAQTVGLYENRGSNYPLKGMKITLLEGGVRGSVAVYSTLLNQKNYINNNLMHITDLYATLLNVAGGDKSLFESHNSINQWDSISNNLTTERQEIPLNIDEIRGVSGIISNSGRYKYLNGSYYSGIFDSALGDTGRSDETPAYNLTAVLESDVNQAIKSLVPSSTPLTMELIQSLRSELDISACNGKQRTEDLPCTGECLFDLWEDPCETTNLVSEEPELLESLRVKLNDYFVQLVPSREQSVDLNANPQYCNGTWFPWLDDNGCYLDALRTINTF